MISKSKVFAVVLAALFAGLFAATALASRSTDKSGGDAGVSFAVNSEFVGDVVLVRRSGGGRGGHRGGRIGGRGHGGRRSFDHRAGRGHGGRRSFGHRPSHRGRPSPGIRGRGHSGGRRLHRRPHSGFRGQHRSRHFGRFYRHRPHHRHHGFRHGRHYGHDRPYYRRYYYYPYGGYYYYPYSRYYFYYYDYLPYDYGAKYKDEYYSEDRPGYDDKGTKFDTYDDVREKIERQRAAEEAKVHEQLERIGEPFRAGDYAEALKRAADAVNADADNAILGFAHVQSLFANGHYDRAADALRQALRNVDMQTQGVLFGADFYPDGDVLKGKIEQLAAAAQADPDDNDMQLLLGYQLIATKRYDAAAEALEKIRNDYVNRHAAGLLVNVLDQLQRSEKEAGG